MFQALFLMILICSELTASVEKYFKKTEMKSDHHRIKNIDFIYILNLDQRPEKFQSCLDQLTVYDIHPFRFSAVNGWELPLASFTEVAVKFQRGMRGSFWGTYYPLNAQGMPRHEIIHKQGRSYFCHCMSRGAVGIVLSHLSILQDAYDSGYETIWVMEDDIQVIQNPHKLSDLISQLDSLVGENGWDVLFTDQDTKNQMGQYVPCLAYAPRPNFNVANPERFLIRTDINQEFREIRARYGAYSMIVRRSGMKKILDFIKEHHIFLPYDMDIFLIPDMQFYTVIEDIVSTLPQAASDNGRPNYLKNTQ
jgi:GR25 family glycosyltransferase involved in LPS biosynthesis